MLILFELKLFSLYFYLSYNENTQCLYVNWSNVLSDYFSEAVYSGFFLSSLRKIPIGVLIQID